jgi:hypothetical protein
METTNLDDAAPAFEEIGGVRYAKWTAQSEPFGTREAYCWRQWACFLVGMAVFLAAKWLALILGVFGGWSIIASIALLVVVAVALFATLIVWVFRRRRAIVTRTFEKWQARSGDVKGVPGAVWTAYGATRCIDHGLISVDGPWLVFRGPRFTLQFLASDLKQGCRKGELRFAYGHPFGKRSIKLIFGGPSAGGWMKRKQADLAVASELEAWRGSRAEGKSIYPPLRNPEVRFEPRFLTVTVPLMLAAYVAVFVGVESVGIPLDWLIGHWSLGEFALMAGILVVAIYALYLFAIVGGYGVRRVMHARNRKIDGLVAAERALG